jgi:hypothetical protein
MKYGWKLLKLQVFLANVSGEVIEKPYGVLLKWGNRGQISTFNTSSITRRGEWKTFRDKAEKNIDNGAAPAI